MAGNLSLLRAGGAPETVYRDAADVIRRTRPTDPVYLFSEGSLRQRVRRFQRGFPGVVGYAVKANPEPRVTRALVEQGVRHFDVASIGEVEAIAARYPGARLHFNNPVKPREAIEQAWRRFGVRSFALDERAELAKILQATRHDPAVTCSVRFKLPHEGACYDFGSKFGAAPDYAARLLAAVAAAGARPALTFHPGSQCLDPDMYAKYLRTAAAIAREAGVEPTRINVGGGFPEQYGGPGIPPLERFFSAIEAAARQAFRRPPPLMCEPGRGLVAVAVSLLARIIHVREDGRTLFLNDGVYGGMQEQALIDLTLPVRVWRDGRPVRGRTTVCRLFGPTCDPTDRLRAAVPLPGPVQAGDYLEFGLLGAYASATATAFNGFQSTVYYNVEEGFAVS